MTEDKRVRVYLPGVLVSRSSDRDFGKAETSKTSHKTRFAFIFPEFWFRDLPIAISAKPKPPKHPLYTHSVLNFPEFWFRRRKAANVKPSP